MQQSYKVFINNRPFSLMTEAGSAANVPGTLVVNYDSPETLLLMMELAHSESVFFGHVIVLHNDPSRVLLKIEKLTRLIEAAGGVVRNLKGEILMIYRNDKWDLPKGKIEKGETPEKAAVREVEEECGISGLKIVRPLPPSYHTYRDGEELVLKKTWWYEMSTHDQSKLVPQQEEGITRVEWMNAEELKSALQNTFASVREVMTH
jgi:8-oxo-dGTP pyrophosphatase MutT (NUDIX family)